MIQIGSDFSGVGAFNQALNRLGIEYNEVFACDMDKYARETFIHNYGEPTYYPLNVYDREIPKQSLDIYMTSPPCQAFSLAGKRKGEKDDRGVLFYNSHEFIKVNKPRYFIFENVKGLLSDDSGKTFGRWIDLLGGKSVNGSPVIFPNENSVPYHVYYKVLNAKNYGVPQNRERIFIVGIRDDSDNTFRFPKEQHLTRSLKDVLEEDVDNKYFLSDKMIEFFVNHTEKMKGKGNGFSFTPKEFNEVASTVTTKNGSRPDDNFIKVKSATKNGYEIATDGDEYCNQGVWIADYRADEGIRIRKDNISPCMTSSMRGGEWKSNQGTRNPPIVGDGYNIRKLTPRECFRLMDFPDDFTWTVSDTQAYKQAGNSIVVNVLAEIIKNLKL